MGHGDPLLDIGRLLASHGITKQGVGNVLLYLPSFASYFQAEGGLYDVVSVLRTTGHARNAEKSGVRRQACGARGSRYRRRSNTGENDEWG